MDQAADRAAGGLAMDGKPPERAPDVPLPAAAPPGAAPPAASRRALIGPIERRTAALSVVLVATVAAAGAGVAALHEDAPAARAAPAPSPASSSGQPAAPAPPGPATPSAVPDVLPTLDAGAPAPTTAGLRRVLGPLLRTTGLGGSVSADVVDLGTGASLFSVAPARPAIPASSAKLLTGAAALSLLGPGSRLATRVVEGGRPGEIVLVGGGDVTVAAGRGSTGSAAGRAGMADLAEATAAALEARGRKAVAVRLDDSLFTGGAISSHWRPGDVRGGFVAPVMALAVDSGSATPGTPLVPGAAADRVADPAIAAARLFAAQLAKQGIGIVGKVARGPAPSDAQTLAAVDSAPVADLVEHALTDSDNTLAEALARLVAVRAGRAATFEDAGRAVLERVGALGVPVAGAGLPGGSGLGDGYRVPARTLTQVLVLAASPDHPELRALLSGLPVAGASGTLTDRFNGAHDKAGLGVVRAKTGR